MVEHADEMRYLMTNWKGGTTEGNLNESPQNCAYRVGAYRPVVQKSFAGARGCGRMLWYPPASPVFLILALNRAIGEIN